MLAVTTLDESQLDPVIHLVTAEHARLCATTSLLEPTVDEGWLRERLATADLALVATSNSVVTGHVAATLSFDTGEEPSAWINPGDFSFTQPDAWDALFEALKTELIRRKITQVHVLAPIAGGDQSWRDHGFSPLHVRSLLSISSLSGKEPPKKCVVRRATLEDLEIIVNLDRTLHNELRVGDDIETADNRLDLHEQWIDAVSDPDTNVWMLEHDDDVIAMCSTFSAPQTLGVFPFTLHLSNVIVDVVWRDRGLGSALITHALANARERGFTRCSTTWRASSSAAERYWTNWGFQPTHMRWRRAVND